MFRGESVIEAVWGINRIEVVSFHDDQIYMTLEYENYDLRSATPESRLKVELVTTGMTNWGLTGSGENCDHLLRVVNTYITPVAFPARRADDIQRVLDGAEPAASPA